MSNFETDPELEFDEEQWARVEIATAESFVEVGGDVLRSSAVRFEAKQTVFQALQSMYEFAIKHGKVKAAAKYEPLLSEFAYLQRGR